MRAIMTFATAAVLGAAAAPLPGCAASPTGTAQEMVVAQGNPNAAQIIESLSPDVSIPMATRGIRPAGSAPRPATDGGTTGQRVSVPRRAEASLTVPFALGSYSISPAAARVLDELGVALTSQKLAGYNFRVEGHTDTTGQPESNKTLSGQRAASVVDYLTAKFGIDRARLMPVGMGQDGLLIQTGPGVAEARNRRVLVVNVGG